jgi:cell division protein FtsZ
MIQWKNQEPEEQQAMNNTGEIEIIGIGTAGVNILDQLVLAGGEAPRMLCIDTERSALAGSVVRSKILVGEQQTRGLGTGGDPEYARELIAAEKGKLADRLRDIQTALIITGVGGGTGSGVAPEIVKMLRSFGARTLVLAVTPFSFEGPRKLRQARTALAELRKVADVVLVLSNDRLARLPEAGGNIREGFRAMNHIVGESVGAITHLLAPRALMQLEIQDLRDLVGDCAALSSDLENCWIGLASATGTHRGKEVVDSVMESPLFDDGEAWSKGDRVLVSLVGGSNLSVAEFQNVVSSLKARLPGGMPVTAGAAIDESRSDFLSLMLVVARSGEEHVLEPAAGELVAGLPDEEPARPKEKAPVEPVVAATVLEEAIEEEIEKAPALMAAEPEPEAEPELEPVAAGVRNKAPKTQRYFAQQEELQLDATAFRGRFEKAEPTVIGGTDLDYPTYMRQKIKIRV